MTGLRYLLDTNICIYIAKQRPPAVARRFAKLPAGAVGMSLITFGELRYGAEKSAQRTLALDTLGRLESLIPVITPDAAVGERYGAIRAHLERSGTPIGNNDLWIAAHALSLGVTLISNNLREFERVPKLKLDNWVLAS
jgi:tRNA(fMet)-specific endonuclease VapC